MNPVVEVLRAVEARIGCIVVRTSDEDCVAEELRTALVRSGHRIEEWSMAAGALSNIDTEAGSMLKVPHKWNPDAAGAPPTPGWLSSLLNGEHPMRVCTGQDCLTIFAKSKKDEQLCPKCGKDTQPSHRTLVLRGCAAYFVPGGPMFDPIFARTLWEIAHQNMRQRANLIMILPYGVTLPDTLADVAIEIEDPYPTREEIAGTLWNELIEGVRPEHRMMLDTMASDTNKRAGDLLAGLSRLRCRNALAQAVVLAAYAPEGEVLQTFLKTLERLKAEGLKASSALEIMTPVDPANIGGLQNLQQWMRRRAKTFSPEAHAHGVRPSLGCALVGVPGSGKSTCAKAMAHILRLPLIKFDLGSVFGKYVGDSESNMRLALKTLDAAAPAVALLDEIDKALAGAGGGSLDGGTSVRTFGTLLTWLAERSSSTKPPIFVVMSANDVRGLPPEYLRRGRIDELFFVDLPTASERVEILRVHMARAAAKGGKMPSFDETQMQLLADRTAGFVGAELEQVVIEAMILAFDAGEAPALTHFLTAISSTKPISLTMRDTIEGVRAWAKDRTVPASLPEPMAIEQAPADPNNTPTGNKPSGRMRFKV